MDGGNPNGLNVLAKYAGSLPEKFRYLPDADESVVTSIDRGILFLMAFWSGSSITAFRRLADALAEQPAGEIEVVVADVDGCSPGLYQIPGFQGVFGGNGEAAWVRHGRVVAATFGPKDVESFAKNTMTLLALP